MRILNNKGFSLIELMVVVAIIAILATIAGPSYQGFQAKARQKEGFALLGNYYTAAQSTFAELGYFPGNFVASGFAPVGQLSYRIAAEDGTDPMFGSNDDTCISTDIMVSACNCGTACAMFRTWQEIAGVNGTSYGAVDPGTPAAMVTPNTFIIDAAGVVSLNGNIDHYTIDQLKVMNMVTDGLQ